MSFLSHQKDIPEFLGNYLKYKRYISNIAETSANEIYFDLLIFFRYLKLILYCNDDFNEETITIEQFKEIDIKNITIKDLNNVTENNIDNFIYFLRYTLKNSPKTINRKLTSIKKLFEYLEQNNLININPSKDTRFSKIPKREPKYLNLEESKRLLATIIKSDERYKIRNYTIACLFLNCSLRLSELVQINLKDMKLDDGTIIIHGKGNRERLIYLNEACIEAINTYLKVRPKLNYKDDAYNALFISNRKKRISRRSVQYIIENVLLELYPDRRQDFHTHTLRHTSATLMYNENNTDIFILKKILGHKCIQATEIYTHISSKKMKYIMENCTISSIIEKMEVKHENK